MDQVELVQLAEPRFVEGGPMRVAGLSGTYTREQTADIPKQWDQFNAELARSGLPYGHTLGVVFPLATMRYVSGIEVAPDAPLPQGWEQVTVPAQRYAIFSGSGGIPMIRRFWVTIFMDWLPKSGRKPADGPMVECYPGDWITSGAFEIWIPVE